MHKVTIGQSTYTVPFFKGRAQRDSGEVGRIYKKISEGDEDTLLGADEYDALAEWFCGAFNHQFTPDELFDGYPADDFIKDVFALYLAMMNLNTKVLTVFPIPVETQKKAK